MYCGDDTIKCFSDATFDKLLDNFHKKLASQNLADALEYSWLSVMDELAKTTFNFSCLPVLFIISIFYSIFIIPLLSDIKKKNEAYKYFKENPEKLSNIPMTLYSECPNCGASNAAQLETCPYCGSLLKLSHGNISFVKPNS